MISRLYNNVDFLSLFGSVGVKEAQDDFAHSWVYSFDPADELALLGV
jgi:hypothetical protein